MAFRLQWNFSALKIQIEINTNGIELKCFHRFQFVCSKCYIEYWRDSNVLASYFERPQRKMRWSLHDTTNEKQFKTFFWWAKSESIVNWLLFYIIWIREWKHQSYPNMILLYLIAIYLPLYSIYKASIENVQIQTLWIYTAFLCKQKYKASLDLDFTFPFKSSVFVEEFYFQSISIFSYSRFWIYYYSVSVASPWNCSLSSCHIFSFHTQ